MLSNLKLSNVKNYRRETSYQKLLVVKDRLETLAQQDAQDKFVERCLRDSLRKIKDSDIKSDMIVLECLVLISSIIGNSEQLTRKVYKNRDVTICCRELLRDINMMCNKLDKVKLEESIKKLVDIIFSELTTRTNYVLLWRIINRYEQIRLLEI
ncbi:hypothetical protein UT300012_21640 [Paraclostridium bifermentans]